MMFKLNWDMLDSKREPNDYIIAFAYLLRAKDIKITDEIYQSLPPKGKAYFIAEKSVPDGASHSATLEDNQK